MRQRWLSEQIVEESFLEDINGMLSTGEVPNLYAPDELGEIREGVKTLARADGREESNDALYAFFIEQVRIPSSSRCFDPNPSILQG